LATGLAVAVFISDADAITEIGDITSPKECGDHLKVTAERSADKLIRYVVRINPETVTSAGQLYSGRVKSSAYLELASANENLASVAVEPQIAKRETEFRFRIAEHLAERSTLIISTNLYEKDGMPTLGGGVVYRIALKGFPPSAKAQ
jgi:hypothetical protein